MKPDARAVPDWRTPKNGGGAPTVSQRQAAADAKRSNIDLIGRLLFFGAIPWLLLAVPRFVLLVWSPAVGSQREQAKAEKSTSPRRSTRIGRTD